MSYLRHVQYRHAQVQRKLRRTRRRLKGFQSPGLRSVGNLLVTNRDNKQAELNDVVMYFAAIIGVAAAVLGGSLFGGFGFLLGGAIGYFGGMDFLKENRFLRG